MTQVALLMERRTRAGNRVLTAEERRVLRERYDEARRRIVAASPAPRLGRSRASIPKQTLDAAYRSHLDGVSVEELASVIWSECGYATQKACEVVLSRHFERAAA